MAGLYAADGSFNVATNTAQDTTDYDLGVGVYSRSGAFRINTTDPGPGVYAADGAYRGVLDGPGTGRYTADGAYRLTTSGASDGAIRVTLVSADGGGGEPFTPWRSATFEFGTNGGTPVNALDGIDETFVETTVSNARAYSGTNSMLCHIDADAAFMGGNIVFRSPRSVSPGVIDNNQEFWCRFRCYIPSSWTIATGAGGMKFFRWRTYESGEVPAASSTYQLWGAGPAPTGLRTEKEGDTPDTRTFTPTGGWNNRWVTFEFYINLRNDTNGALRAWVDGELRGELLNVNTAGSNTWVAMHLMFLDFFNNNAPQDQDLWIDNIDVAWSGDASPTTQDAAGNFYMGV